MSSEKKHVPRIVLTGCTGFVGRQLVEKLEARGVDLLLVGRDAKKVASLFPGRKICEYALLAERGRSYDLLIHLAVLNNNSDATEAEFEAVNVELAIRTAEAARTAEIADFYYVSSFHALDASNVGPYAESKRLASDKLRQLSGVRIVELFLPAVYGASVSGKLRYLRFIPQPIRGIVLTVLSSLRPTIQIDTIAQYFVDSHRDRERSRVLLSNDQDENAFYRFVTRSIDLIFALSVFLFLNWLLLIFWVLIRLDSQGPGIFAQQRVGRYGKVFTCYKFRTMADGTPQAGSHEVTSASVTGIGRVMRRTKIDELPQIWNIFRNEISLVGPRPCLPAQELLIKERNDRGVLTIKPGITGYSQINDVDMSEPSKLAEFDARYKALRSIILYLRIIISTAIGGGQGDKVREK